MSTPATFPMPNPRYYGARVVYTKPDAYSRNAWGYMVGERDIVHADYIHGDSIDAKEVVLVAVIWMDGMVTVERLHDLTLSQA